MSPGRLPLLLVAGSALIAVPAQMGGIWSWACCAVAALAVLASAVRPWGAAPAVAVGASFLAWVLDAGAHPVAFAALEGVLALSFLLVVQLLATAPPRAGIRTATAVVRQVGPVAIAGAAGGVLLVAVTATNPPVSLGWVLIGTAALPAAYFVAVRPFGRAAEQKSAS